MVRSLIAVIHRHAEPQGRRSAPAHKELAGFGDLPSKSRLVDHRLLVVPDVFQRLVVEGVKEAETGVATHAVQPQSPA
jgi:hypothetical protein